MELVPPIFPRTRFRLGRARPGRAFPDSNRTQCWFRSHLWKTSGKQSAAARCPCQPPSVLHTCKTSGPIWTQGDRAVISVRKSWTRWSTRHMGTRLQVGTCFTILTLGSGLVPVRRHSFTRSLGSRGTRQEQVTDAGWPRQYTHADTPRIHDGRDSHRKTETVARVTWSEPLQGAFEDCTVHGRLGWYNRDKRK